MANMATEQPRNLPFEGKKADRTSAEEMDVDDVVAKAEEG